MWDWAHFQAEGWLAHTTRSARFTALLLLSGLAMALHMVIPFWQQPKWLCADQIISRLSDGLESRKE
jgi:uncharacterized membrane protein SirB2